MHLQENLNGSVFTEDVVTQAIPSLSNTPIMGLINPDSEDFEGHERELEFHENGEVNLKNITVAYGVIPEYNNAQFEDRVGDDGITRTYLTVEGLLWNKWEDAVQILNSKRGMTGQSMELSDNYSGRVDDDGLFYFTKFMFDGACLLGDDVEPAMVNSTVEVAFSQNEKVEKTIQEKLAIYTKSLEEGGTNLEDIKDKELEDKELEFDETDESGGGSEGEGTPEEPTEPEQPETPEEPEEEPQPEVTTEEVTETTDSVAYETEERETDELPKGETRVAQEGQDGYTEVVYLVTYHDGEEHSKEEKTRNVVEPVTKIVEVGTHVEEPEEDVRKEDTLNEARAKGIEDASKAMTGLENIVIGDKTYTVEEVTELVEELFALKQKLHNEKVEELFAQHADNLTAEEIEGLKKDSDSKSIEVLENELFSILGRKSFSNKKQESPTTKYTSVKVDTTEKDDDPYGGILSKK